MKEKDVMAMNKVLEYLDSQPIEQELYDAFALAVANCNLEIAKQRLHYRKNAVYYRQKKKEWAEKNPEKAKMHQIEYRKRIAEKKKAEEKKGLNTDNIPEAE